MNSPATRESSSAVSWLLTGAKGARSLTSGQTRVLLTLTLVNLVNFVDRQIIFALVPLIRVEFALSYFHTALLGTVFSIVHSVGTLPLGWLADRVSRKKVISYAILFWSGATFLSGLATSFRSLLGARALVGVGEAAYTPAATAIITGGFPRELRARVQGVFDSGMFIGGSVGLGLGSILAEWIGWRPTFFIVGIPGLLLALSILRMPEAPVRTGEKPIPVRQLFRVPAYVTLLMSGCFITFAAYSYIFWGTEFVYRYKGFRLQEAGLLLGLSLLVAGVLGILAGAAVADRLSRRYSWGRVLVIATGLLLGAPLLLWAFYTPSKSVFLALFLLACFFMSWYHGPLTATMHDLIPARAHATAVGLYLFFANLLGTTLAPVVIGKIADRYDLLTGLHAALAAQVLGGLCFFLVIHFILRDGLHHPALAQYR